MAQVFEPSDPSHRRAPSEEELKRIVGHRFPGGVYLVQHWENFLLTECTGANLLPDGMVHPVVLFHLPILGAGTSIAEMFALGMAESDFSISIESYDWEMLIPLRENVRYKVGGSVLSADRRLTFDRIAFQFEVCEPEGALAARTTIIWRYSRSELS